MYSSKQTQVEPSITTGIHQDITEPSPHKPVKLEIRINRTYHFESAHHLPLVPDGHKCKNMHGHNYRVDIVMQGELDSRGFIKDFAEIDDQVLPLIRRLDHRVL